MRATRLRRLKYLVIVMILNNRTFCYPYFCSMLNSINNSLFFIAKFDETILALTQIKDQSPSFS